jgi:hypothetical protein
LWTAGRWPFFGLDYVDIPCTFHGASHIKIIALHRSVAGPGADTSWWHQPRTLLEQKRKIGCAPKRRRWSDGWLETVK